MCGVYVVVIREGRGYGGAVVKGGTLSGCMTTFLDCGAERRVRGAVCGLGHPSPVVSPQPHRLRGSGSLPRHTWLKPEAPWGDWPRQLLRLPHLPPSLLLQPPRSLPPGTRRRTVRGRPRASPTLSAKRRGAAPGSGPTSPTQPSRASGAPRSWTTPRTRCGEGRGEAAGGCKVGEGLGLEVVW